MSEFSAIAPVPDLRKLMRERRRLLNSEPLSYHLSSVTWTATLMWRDETGLTYETDNYPLTHHSFLLWFLLFNREPPAVRTRYQRAAEQILRACK